MSHPHGCVSWNANQIMNGEFNSKSHPHGCVSWNIKKIISEGTIIIVTPSRVCELKLKQGLKKQGLEGHTLTGVWVEMLWGVLSLVPILSHPHGCVSWNDHGTAVDHFNGVTPSRVCELKCKDIHNTTKFHRHTLTGVWVEMKNSRRLLICCSHTLTGVWVEINEGALFLTKFPCHTLTGVWVEISFTDIINPLPTSHPHGYVLKIMTISR